MDLIFQVPVQYCSLSHWTSPSPPDTSTTEHHFHFSPAASLFLELLVIALHPSSITYWILLTWEAYLPISYLFAPLYCSWGSRDRNTGWFAIPSSSGPHFVRTLHFDPSILGGPVWHGPHTLFYSILKQ